MKAFLISDNHDSLVGMRLAGVEGVLAHTADEVEDAIQQARARRDLAILAITEKAAALAPILVKQLRERGDLPLVIEIPDRNGSSRSSDFLTKYVREAIGVKM